MLGLGLRRRWYSSSPAALRSGDDCAHMLAATRSVVTMSLKEARLEGAASGLLATILGGSWLAPRPVTFLGCCRALSLALLARVRGEVGTRLLPGLSRKEPAAARAMARPPAAQASQDGVSVSHMQQQNVVHPFADAKANYVNTCTGCMLFYSPTESW